MSRSPRPISYDIEFALAPIGIAMPASNQSKSTCFRYRCRKPPFSGECHRCPMIG